MRFANSHAEFSTAARRAQKIDESIARIAPQALRHTAASFAISSGADVKAVQKMLGHASAAMIIDTYADLFDDDLDAGTPKWWLGVSWSSSLVGVS